MMVHLDFVFQAIRPADTYISMHRHSCYELVYYQGGTGTTRLGTLDYGYQPHTYTIIRPDTLHDERRTEETEVLCAGFRMGQTRLPPLYEGMFNDTPDLLIEKLLLNAKKEMQERHAHYDAKLDLLMSQIWIEHVRRAGSANTGGPDEKLFYALKYMDEHFNQKIRIEDLSEMAGYSYDHFRHLFKEQFDVSPMQYVMNKRLEHARRLLRYTELSITSVAMECGFSSDAQFCTIFKRETGETPRSYRLQRWGFT